jgi:hypothetical protein
MNIPAQLQSSQSTKKPHLFRLSPEVIDCFDIDDAVATYDDMAEMYLDQDPYDFYCVEVNTSFILKFSGFLGMGDGNFEETKRIAEKWVWVFQYQTFEDETYIGEVFVTLPSGRVANYSQSAIEDKAADAAITHIEQSLRCFLKVLLATKNIDKKTTFNHKRSVSPRTQKDAKRYSHTTLIKIGKITESYGSSTGSGGVKRAHLRRGHIRTQRFGKGNAEVKKIFIQPVFVNADENWINEQKTYRVVA